MEVFEDIYFNSSKTGGKCRFAELGLGWKPMMGGEPFTLASADISLATWSRAARGQELKVLSRQGGVIQLDGFQLSDFERLTRAFRQWYSVTIESVDHSVRGWNWGKVDFGKAELAFNVQSRPAFEVSYAEISNTNLSGKNEVTIELAANVENGTTGDGNSTNMAKSARKIYGAGAGDQLIEMRFYIPGNIAKSDKDSENKASDDDGMEEHNAANIFYNTLVEKAEIGEISGDNFASFKEVLHLTPRGRFDIDMYEKDFRLRGKTYDYKIQYDSIKKFLLLPKPDDTHMLITIGLEPPIRQGQTRYPFLVMQFKKDEEVILDLNMTEEQLESEKYRGKLQSNYELPIAQVVASLFRGLAGKKVITPSKSFVSHHQQSGVKCSIKANEGHLFFLDKSFIFVPKPATYISFENISSITMSRVGGGTVSSSSRTFDIMVTLRNDMGEHQFSNINREEQGPMEDFFRAKNIKIKNEMAEDSRALLAAALKYEGIDSSDDEADNGGRGSADENDESLDESFEAESDSEVAEEYDSEHESTGDSNSDEDRSERQDEDDDDDDRDEDGDSSMKIDSRPNKKQRRHK